jgi:hypothetical protein
MAGLRTEQFPQADRLHQVGLVAVAVSNGHTTDSAIERSIGLHSENRQGRYYRKAAEILGLIRTSANKSSLTPVGADFVKLSKNSDKTEFLAKCLTDTPVFREVTKFIAQRKPQPSQLADFIVGIYPGSETTARRRASTIAAFVEAAGLAKLQAGAYVPGPLAAVSLIQEEESKSGLFGKPVPKDAGTDEPLVAKPPYKIEIDSAKTERANLIHHKLVTAKAGFLEERALPARQNESVDLYSESKGDTVLYEMKSVSESNFVPQVRRAISQLYEYRYVFGVADARLCVVTNRYPEPPARWYLKYLQQDRRIAYLWTEDFAGFECEPASATLLGEFSP